MATATLTTAKTASTMDQPEAWKQETVGAFFARCNWENLTLPAHPVAQPGTATTLDYGLSVGQFFGAIPWKTGEMLAIATPAAEAIVASSSNKDSSDSPDLSAAESGSALEELPELSDIADESHLDGGDVTLDDFLGSFSNSL